MRRNPAELVRPGETTHEDEARAFFQEAESMVRDGVPRVQIAIRMLDSAFYNVTNPRQPLVGRLIIETKKFHGLLLERYGQEGIPSQLNEKEQSLRTYLDILGSDGSRKTGGIEWPVQAEDRGPLVLLCEKKGYGYSWFISKGAKTK